MAKFFVGQQVKVIHIYQPENTHLLGMQGRITEVAEHRGETHYGLDVVPILRDGRQGSFIVGFVSDQLAPITPHSHEPAQFGFHELMDRLRSGVVA